MKDRKRLLHIVKSRTKYISAWLKDGRRNGSGRKQTDPSDEPMTATNNMWRERGPLTEASTIHSFRFQVFSIVFTCTIDQQFSPRFNVNHLYRRQLITSDGVRCRIVECIKPPDKIEKEVLLLLLLKVIVLNNIIFINNYSQSILVYRTTDNVDYWGKTTQLDH
jgi:hypothetical protein